MLTQTHTHTRVSARENKKTEEKISSPKLKKLKNDLVSKLEEALHNAESMLIRL